MTRKEAITVLKAFMENPLFSEVHKAAFNIAIHDIKAYQDWNINNLILVNKDNYEPIEQESTTKNDLVVDKEQLKTMIRGLTKWYVKRDNTEVGEPNTAVGLLYDDVMFGIDRLHPVTPQEPQSFKWCDTCKEYDQEKHCCHRYSKVIRDTVAEIEQEPRWILVSEKLPEYGEEVLTCSNGGFIEIQSLENRCDGYWENQKGDWSDLDEIIAWMPLLKPYEPQESEDKE